MWPKPGVQDLNVILITKIHEEKKIILTSRFKNKKNFQHLLLSQPEF